MIHFTFWSNYNIRYRLQVYKTCVINKKKKKTNTCPILKLVYFLNLFISQNLNLFFPLLINVKYFLLLSTLWIYSIIPAAPQVYKRSSFESTTAPPARFFGLDPPIFDRNHVFDLEYKSNSSILKCILKLKKITTPATCE